MADRYRRKGPERTTRTLLDLVTCRAGAGGTVLDIGGGTKAGMDQEPLLEVLMDSAAAPKTMADPQGGPVAYRIQ